MGTSIRTFDLTGLSAFVVPSDPSEDAYSTWRFTGSPNANCQVSANAVAGQVRVVDNECDKTILVGEGVVNVRTFNQFVLDGTKMRPGNPVGVSVATVADLTSSLFDARMADGTDTFVAAAGATHGKWTLDKTSVLTVDGNTVVATLSGVGRWIYFGPGSGLGPSATGDVPFWLVGDSIGVGSGAQYVGGWRAPMERYLRRERSDFDFVGSVATMATSSSRDGLVWHSCMTARTWQSATAALVAELALCATTPRAIVVMLGTNNIIAGEAAAAIQARVVTYVNAAFAAVPANSLLDIFLWIPPPFVAGASVGGNLAAWTATRAALRLLMIAYAATDARLHVIDTDGVLGAGDYQEGVHPNKNGNSGLGRTGALALDAWMGIAARRRGIVPRAFEERNLSGSLALKTVNDGARLATGLGGLDMPAGSSYMLQFDWYPRELGVGPFTVASIAGRATQPATWMLIAQRGNGLELQFYDGTSQGVVSGFACDQILKVNKWHRIVAIWFAASATLSVFALYVNGRLVGLLTSGASNWIASVGTFFFGTALDYVGVVSNYAELHCAKGAAVPRPGSMAALRMVEDNYYDDAPIAAGAGEAACYELDAALTDEVSGNAALAAINTAAIVAAYPAGSPLKPWEVTADAPWSHNLQSWQVAFNDDCTDVNAGGPLADITEITSGSTISITFTPQTDRVRVFFHMVGDNKTAGLATIQLRLGANPLAEVSQGAAADCGYYAVAGQPVGTSWSGVVAVAPGVSQTIKAQWKGTAGNARCRPTADPTNNVGMEIVEVLDTVE